MSPTSRYNNITYGARGNMRAALRAIGATLWTSDRAHDWWTIPNDAVANRFYDIRDNLPFEQLLCEVGRDGGLVVYYDQPRM